MTNRSSEISPTTLRLATTRALEMNVRLVLTPDGILAMGDAGYYLTSWFDLENAHEPARVLEDSMKIVSRYDEKLMKETR